MIDYVVGLAFSDDKSHVVTIRKLRPNWQAGMLNGIGGKIESGETPHEAMVREFKEETGCYTDSKEWRYFALIEGKQWRVYFFTTTVPWHSISTQEEEVVGWTYVNSIISRSFKCCDQLYWILPMARDKQILQPVKIFYQYDWENPDKVCVTCNKPEIECRCPTKAN